MRLSSREGILVVAALAAVCLVVFLAVSTANSSGGAAAATEAAPAPAVSVQEKPQEEFSLTLDERGLRSDWQRSPEEKGSLRIDVNDRGLNIHTQGTSVVSGVAAADEPSKRCTCDCGGCRH